MACSLFVGGQGRERESSAAGLTASATFISVVVDARTDATRHIELLIAVPTISALVGTVAWGHRDTTLVAAQQAGFGKGAYMPIPSRPRDHQMS